MISFVPAVALDTLVENCHKLLEKFHYSWEMMPLIFVILNYAGSDLDEASRKIDEGKVFINEYARKHNLNIFDGLELRNSTRHSIADPDEKRPPEIPTKQVPKKMQSEINNISGVLSSSMKLFCE
ncbi:protein doublesex-like [Choristoneura fumiferana]|uniref:protein doublesex-like n=1 Tax=Choristoneura fumiferana TaxID=7141 RepID=UPI003D1549FF